MAVATYEAVIETAEAQEYLPFSCRVLQNLIYVPYPSTSGIWLGVL